jgi:hypothetical protein
MRPIRKPGTSLNQKSLQQKSAGKTGAFNRHFAA